MPVPRPDEISPLAPPSDFTSAPQDRALNAPHVDVIQMNHHMGDKAIERDRGSGNARCREHEQVAQQSAAVKVKQVTARRPVFPDIPDANAAMRMASGIASERTYRRCSAVGPDADVGVVLELAQLGHPPDAVTTSWSSSADPRSA
jgi:hypothetical protein